MSKTERIFYHPRKKYFPSTKEINIKVNLKDESINDKLLNYKCQNFNQLLNYQVPIKKKLSFFSSKKKNNKLNEISEDLKKNEIEILTDSSFQETLANSSYDSPENNNNNSFDSLNDDYTIYTDILKKIYPYFEFNHYNKIKDEYYEYFKKYGDNDINNRHSKYNIKNEKNNENKKYKKSNLLDILGVQKGIDAPPELFRIKDDFLSRSDITEINMIKKDLSFKTSIIDKELESILEAQSGKFYNYIEKNDNFVKQISYYADDIKLKREMLKIIKRNYMNNNMKLILKEKKKKELEKVLKITHYMNDLKNYVNYLKNLSVIGNKNENNIKEMGKYTKLAKEKIEFLKKCFNNKECKFLISIEKIVNIYENKSELNLIQQFISNVKILIESCLIYDKDNNITDLQNMSVNNDNYYQNKDWILALNKKDMNNILIAEKDFELLDNDKNIYIKYLLLYNNNNKNNISKIILNILNLFSLIIKYNNDISFIISLFQEIFINIINYNLKEIEAQTTNKLLLIKIISNCYSILLSNYWYIIYLININFGLNLQNFNELTNLMKTQMTKLIIELIKSYLNEIIYENWKYFIDGYIQAKNNCEIYFKINNLNWNDITFDIYKKFIMIFKETKTKELMNEYNKNNNINLSWDQLTNIDNKYQKMFEKLYIETNIDKIELKHIDINQKINKNNNILSLYNTENNNLIYFINESNGNDCGHKISNFSYLFIKYSYEFLCVYILSNDLTLKKMLIEKLYKVTKDLLLYTEDIIVNNPTGLINNIKKITEKEISLYYSDLLVIENCLKNFLLIYPDTDINEILYELKSNCIDIIEDSLQNISDIIIQEFNNLSFDNYNKENNNFAKNFYKFKKIYDDLGNAFTSESIKQIFYNKFELLFNDMNTILLTKGIIKNDKTLSHFKNDIMLIKTILSLLDLGEINELNEMLDNYIKIVNPNQNI